MIRFQRPDSRSAAAPSAVFIFALLAGPALGDDAPGGPSYAKEVSRILQAKCLDCHRAGQIAPMALTSYEEVRPWAKSIRKAAAERTMPPWPAAPGVREYKNDRSLTAAEIETISRWVDAGAPEGDSADLPPPPVFNENWILGEPDAIVEMAEAWEIPAEGGDIYRCFVLDPKLTEDRWVNRVEVQPGSRVVSHHVVMYVDKRGTIGPGKDAEDPGPGYECFGSPGFQASQLAGWGPGLSPKVYPEGTGHLIPAGGKIVMQMHYHPSGKPERDKTRAGLHFAKTPVNKALRDGIAINFRLEIEPGDANYPLEASRPVGEDITIHSIAPHMHLLGKSIEILAEKPGGETLALVNIPRWDFHWQTEYLLAEPVKLPAGSKVWVKGVFDNSAANPNQPVSPPKRVTFGEQTTDEMLVGVYFYTRDSENLAAKP